MILLYLFFFTILVFCSLRDFKKTVLVFSALQPFLHFGVCIVSSPTLSLKTAGILWLLILYFIKRNSISASAYPLAKISIIYTIATVFLAYFVDTHISSYATYLLQDIVLNVGLGFLFWQVLGTPRDIRFFTHVLASVFVVICTYAIFEALTISNPVLDFERSLLPDGGVSAIWQSNEIRFGLKRCQSVCSIHLVFGGFCAFFATFFYRMYTNYPRLLSSKCYSYRYLIFILGSLGVLLCNSKSSMICFLVAMSLQFLNPKYLKGKYLIRFLIVLPIIFLALQPFIEAMIVAMDEDKAAEMGGSSYAMRDSQLELVLYKAWEAPFLGHGLKSMGELFRFYQGALLGAESVWFNLLYERGLVGCILHLVLCLSICIYWRIDIMILSIPVAWVIFETVTSTPGMDFSFPLILCLVLIKSRKYYANQFNINITNKRICTHI